jgi:predicted Zn finger-like uncharacterized protein
MKISCPECKQQYEVEDNCAGEKVECLECHNTFVVAITFNFISLYLFFIWAPLYLAAFVLAIVSIAQRRVFVGIMILIASVFAPAVVILVRFVIMLSMFPDQPSQDSLSGKVVSPKTVDEKTAKLVEVAPEVTGAFGIKFGDSYTSKMNKNNIEKTNDGDFVYFIDAPKKFREFNKLCLFITPKTHKIYAILTAAKLETKDKAKAEYEIISGMLSQKYKIKPERIPFHYDGSGCNFCFKDNGISLYTEDSKALIKIMYVDNDLAELAKKERLEIESKKSDSSAI